MGRRAQEEDRCQGLRQGRYVFGYRARMAGRHEGQAGAHPQPLPDGTVRGYAEVAS